MSMNKNLNRKLEELSILSQSKEGIGEKESKEKERVEKEEKV